MISNENTITVEYLPSTLNKLVDQESRRRVDSSEWMLKKYVFSNLCFKLGTPETDLFASRVSYQLPSIAILSIIEPEL